MRTMDKFEVTLVTRDDAERFIKSLRDILAVYSMVQVADAKELVGMPTTHVDQKWGWTNLDELKLQKVRAGWNVVLPAEEKLNVTSYFPTGPSKEPPEVQTRDGHGALCFFHTVKEAMEHAEKNPDVWKVSFAAEDGSRVRLVRRGTPLFRFWSYEPIELKTEPTPGLAAYKEELSNLEVLDVILDPKGTTGFLSMTEAADRELAFVKNEYRYIGEVRTEIKKED